MSDLRVKRRSFLGTLLAIPVGLLAEQQKVQPSGVSVKVTSGVDRFNDVRMLPGGDLFFVKVATQDTAGAFFLTEQPISRKWAGPPRHFHYEQDEWFYCLAGEYVVEVGNQRFELAPGDSCWDLGECRMRLRSLATPPANFSSDSRLPGRWKSFSANWKSGADISGRALLRTRRQLVSITGSKAWDHPCHHDGARVLISLRGAKTSPSKKRFA